MSQSNLFVDIGHSAVKWRTLDSEVFSQSADKFSEKFKVVDEKIYGISKISFLTNLN